MPNRDPVICQEFLPPDFSTAVDNHSFFLKFHIFISSQHTVYSMSRDGKDGNLHIFPVDFWYRLTTTNWQLGPQGTLFSKISTYVTRVFCINSHLWALETYCLEKKNPCHRHLPYPYMSPGRWLHCWSRHVSWALPGVTPSRRLTELRKSRFNSLLKALLAPRHKAGSRNPELVELLEGLVCYCLGAEQFW